MPHATRSGTAPGARRRPRRRRPRPRPRRWPRFPRPRARSRSARPPRRAGRTPPPPPTAATSRTRAARWRRAPAPRRRGRPRTRYCRRPREHGRTRSRPSAGRGGGRGCRARRARGAPRAGRTRARSAGSRRTGTWRAGRGCPARLRAGRPAPAWPPRPGPWTAPSGPRRPRPRRSAPPRAGRPPAPRRARLPSFAAPRAAGPRRRTPRPAGPRRPRATCERGWLGATARRRTWRPAGRCRTPMPARSRARRDAGSWRPRRDERQPGGSAVVDEPQKLAGVDVLGDEVAEHIEPALAHRLEADMPRLEVASGVGGNLAEQPAPELVAVEYPVPRGAADGTGRAAAGKRVARDGSYHSVVDFVTGCRCARCVFRAPAEHLFPAEPDVRRQQSQAGDGSRASFHVVADVAGEHLEPGADADHRPAGGGAGGDRGGQAALAQPGQVGDGGPAARQDHQVRRGDLARRGDEADGHPWLGGERG